jgi:hypothetical protein
MGHVYPDVKPKSGDIYGETVENGAKSVEDLGKQKAKQVARVLWAVPS